MISILKKTTPRVSRFLLGVLPLFVGYALLGMVAFGDQVGRFATSTPHLLFFCYWELICVSSLSFSTPSPPQVDQFGDVTQTLRTLFSVVNGDIIYQVRVSACRHSFSLSLSLLFSNHPQTFKAVEFMGLGGQCYLYVYILVFTYVVLMTIIAIVEEAFFEASGTGDGRENERPRGGALPLDPAPPRGVNGNDPHPLDHPASRHNSRDTGGAPADRDRLDSSVSVSSTSTTGRRPLPDSLRLLLHAQEMVREHEDHEERRKSRNSVSGIDHVTPFYR